MLDIDTITGGRDGRDSIAGVLVCNDTTYECVSEKLQGVLVGKTYSMHPDP